MLTGEGRDDREKIHSLITAMSEHEKDLLK